MPGNSLAYFGPKEALLRSVTRSGRDHFSSCQAGRAVLGIESNGAVKGYPSLQPTYIGGNLCHYRARTRARSGRRECLVARDPAPGVPFDNGRFDIIEEAIDAPDVLPARALEYVQIRRNR